MKDRLLILGAGQYGTVAKEIAESMQCFEKIDFLDDQNEIAIDKLAHYRRYATHYSHAIVAIGDAELRLSYLQGLEQAGFQLATLISPYAYVSPSAQILKGSIVEPMAVINPEAMLAVGVIVCAGAIVNHNATVERGCLLQCGSVVAARATVRPLCTLAYHEVFPALEIPVEKRI